MLVADLSSEFRYSLLAWPSTSSLTTTYYHFANLAKRRTRSPTVCMQCAWKHAIIGNLSHISLSQFNYLYNCKCVMVKYDSYHYLNYFKPLPNLHWIICYMNHRFYVWIRVWRQLFRGDSRVDGLRHCHVVICGMSKLVALNYRPWLHIPLFSCINDDNKTCILGCGICVFYLFKHCTTRGLTPQVRTFQIRCE